MIIKSAKIFYEDLALDYKDVFLYPQFSEVSSRKLVDTSSELFPGLRLDVPLISSNMDTITDGSMAKAMAAAGGIGAIHRFMTIEENIREYQIATSCCAKGVKYPCLVSVGVNEESKERAQELYKYGARYFAIDIAHGHSKLMKDMITWMKLTLKDVYVIAGSIATGEAVRDLISWGADALRLGVGPGSVCLTKNITGTTVPIFSTILDCAKKMRELKGLNFVNRNVPLIADGGALEIGDIAKALGAGADFVMSGRMLAVCKETPGPRVNGQKIYRGSSSRDVMLKIKDETNLPTPEGTSILIDETEETAYTVLKQIKGGLQSAFSYSNAKTLKEFQENAVFGLRFTATK